MAVTSRTLLTDEAEAEATPWADLPERRRRRLTAALPWLGTLIATMVAIASTVLWLRADGSAADPDIELVASQFLTAFVNWDATDGLDEVLVTVGDLGTEGLLRQLENDELPPDLREQLTGAAAQSAGNVVDLVVEPLPKDDAHAVAYALVEQVVSSVALPEPTTTCGAAHLKLAFIDGEWRVAELDVFDRDGPCPVLEG